MKLQLARRQQSSATASKLRHHIDRRAARIIVESVGDDADDLLTTKQMSDWLGVSPAWLEIGRIRNYGPKFTRLSDRLIRYRRSDVIKWLEKRTYASTSEYA